MPGIGDILGLTIMLEVGDISRFPKVSNYGMWGHNVRPLPTHSETTLYVVGQPSGVAPIRRLNR